MPLIDENNVNDVFRDCLFRAEEVDAPDATGARPTPENAVVVEGIIATFAFHPGRLEEIRPVVQRWLEALPSQFQKSGGGGWSFLNACDDRAGEQWTGLHERMDQLFCLGLGLKLVECQMPRDFWDALPGGMPYYAVCDGGGGS